MFYNKYMESDNANEKKTINIDDMTVQQSLDTIWTLMNKAANKGVFSIDESYVLKILFSRITNHLSSQITQEQKVEDENEKVEEENKSDDNEKVKESKIEYNV